MGDHPKEKSGATTNEDHFHLVSIKPHPCDEKSMVLMDDSEPVPEYTTGLIPPAKIEYSTLDITDEERSNLPANWDWRDHIKGGHKAKAAQVINQGGCGSCWAFGAATTMAYRFNIASKGQYDAIPSPQVGMSCVSEKTGKGPCGGGWMPNFYDA